MSITVCEAVAQEGNGNYAQDRIFAAVVVATMALKGVL